MAQPIHPHNFDFEWVLIEAQHRWLRPLEICEVLRNYKKFNIALEPPNMPPSGSLFLFDRKVLRYFRKDGHNWRKKKDGKTIREAHERLKAGSVDVLHCYYAHGEDDENFQRRSYWMLEEDLSHIVLVHYREVKGYRTKFNCSKEADEAIPSGPEYEQDSCNSEVENSSISSLQRNCYQLLSQTNVNKNLNIAHVSDYEDAVSDCDLWRSNTSPPLDVNDDKSVQKHQKDLDVLGWEDALKSHNGSVQAESVERSVCNMEQDSLGIIAKQGNELVKQLLTDVFHENHPFSSHVHPPQVWQVPVEDEVHLGSLAKLKDTKMEKLHDYLGANSSCLDEQSMYALDHDMQPPHVLFKEEKLDTESNMTSEKRSGHFSASRCQLDCSFKDKGLKKNDSFNQWMSKELGDVEPVPQSCSDGYWDAVDNGSDCLSLSSQAELDSCTLAPSLSEDQLFRIIDFSPNWGYAGSETKVLVAGKFLKTQEGTGNCQWSCMFGETEIPAEVITDGVLRCHTPIHVVGRVPFYVTCSNRLACSEVREFEYRDKSVHNMDATSLGYESDALRIRFGRLLSLGSGCYQHSISCNLSGSTHPCNEASSLCKSDNDEWFQILKLTTTMEGSSLGEVKERLADWMLKEKFSEWLLCKEADGGNGHCLLDEDGLGVLHFSAALGYDWAIAPSVAAGVNVNYRDVRGWTALHWAASYGRERTVVHLISLGASAGALTDPTSAYPTGRMAADFASEKGHKGIAGYLAESALSAHLASLSLKNNKDDDAADISGMIPVLTASERTAIPMGDGDHLDKLALKDSLGAVCNATQAASRIHQVYRLQSFRKKQMKQIVDKGIDSSDKHAHSVVAINSQKQGPRNEPVHAAAIRIQKKFRGWKGRNEFLTIRQQVVKIQAHVRGHQVRRHYKKFVWSVGILEKVIIRWRRKRRGLRGFKPETLTVASSSAGSALMEDDYDFLVEGRKQAEGRLQKALSRVKSMVQYPEARDQYRRLLTTLSEIKRLKGESSEAIGGSEAAYSMDDDAQVDVDTPLNDDSLVPTDC